MACGFSRANCSVIGAQLVFASEGAVATPRASCATSVMLLQHGLENFHSARATDQTLHWRARLHGAQACSKTETAVHSFAICLVLLMVALQITDWEYYGGQRSPFDPSMPQRTISRGGSTLSRCLTSSSHAAPQRTA
eukprot:5716-Heterococcus_DN1.PRE.2